MTIVSEKSKEAVGIENTTSPNPIVVLTWSNGRESQRVPGPVNKSAPAPPQQLFQAFISGLGLNGVMIFDLFYHSIKLLWDGMG